MDDSSGNDPNDVRTTEGGGKEDMFVDCPDELIVSDDREALPIPEIQQRSEEKDDVQDIRVHELNNGAQDHDLTDELVHLRAMLEKTIDEKECSAREYKVLYQSMLVFSVLLSDSALSTDCTCHAGRKRSLNERTC